MKSSLSVFSRVRQLVIIIMWVIITVNNITVTKPGGPAKPNPAM
jgi:hypothetical protein